MDRKARRRPSSPMPTAAPLQVQRGRCADNQVRAHRVSRQSCGPRSAGEPARARPRQNAAASVPGLRTSAPGPFAVWRGHVIAGCAASLTAAGGVRESRPRGSRGGVHRQAGGGRR
jgi:hypothetical protein